MVVLQGKPDYAEHMSDAKTRVRESILTHLQTWEKSGLRLVSPESKQALTRIVEANAMDCQTLDELKAYMEAKPRCQLCLGATRIVFGSGNPKASLMFIGEAPGADEDAQGLPFVGAAGQLLTAMIKAMKLDRDKDVYIANIIKCRPPSNRKPTNEEISQCSPYLFRQIELIAPKIIVCLGSVPAATLLKTEVPISKMRGTFQMMGNIRIMPTFHPAYLLRNSEMKKPVWRDLQLVVQAMKELGIYPPTPVV
jgi:DNA polymerase